MERYPKKVGIAPYSRVRYGPYRSNKTERKTPPPSPSTTPLTIRKVSSVAKFEVAERVFSTSKASIITTKRPLGNLR